jgi:hypothetical protein
VLLSARDVHGARTDSELILMNKTEQQLTSKLLGGFIAGLLITGLGLRLGWPRTLPRLARP